MASPATAAAYVNHFELQPLLPGGPHQPDNDRCGADREQQALQRLLRVVRRRQRRRGHHGDRVAQVREVAREVDR
jgi:hypothetical protein